jgi:hypothetical protein
MRSCRPAALRLRFYRLLKCPDYVPAIITKLFGIVNYDCLYPAVVYDVDMEQKDQPPERRFEPRAAKLSDCKAEFKFTGIPVYQLKVRDLSAKGAGVVARADSHFMKLIHIGQELDLSLISPEEAGCPAGRYRSRIEHISELKRGRFKGHMVVGIRMLGRIKA